MKKKPTVDELVKRIEDTKGNVAAVARSFGVSRTAVYNWMNEVAGLAAQVVELRDELRKWTADS